MKLRCPFTAPLNLMARNGDEMKLGVLIEQRKVHCPPDHRSIAVTQSKSHETTFISIRDRFATRDMLGL